ncbi:MAG TPA: murein biosynthesis integral membrane protein MurJ [Micromonosporaceae bacterium]
MTDYRGRRRRPEDERGHDPDATAWIDQGPYEEEYEEPPRRYSTSDQHYGDGTYPSGSYATGTYVDGSHTEEEPTRPIPHPPPTQAPPPGRQTPPTDADATVLMPSLRNAPQAPPTPLPELKFNAADTTMLMSAMPYFTPSATPAYTGTIYVSYAASRARMEDEAAAVPESEREGAARSVARNSAIMALGSIVSRLTGFLRVAVLGAAVGAGVIGDTYTTANTVPSMVYELLLGGILTSVLVPVLVRARENDPDRGQAFTQRLLTLSVIILGAATVLAVAAAPLLAAVMSSDNHGPAERELVTSLAYLLLPEVFFFGIAGILGAVLNTRGHFAAPMWTPILNNVVVIGTLVLFMTISDQATLNPENMTSSQVLVLGLGTTAGIAVQAFGLVPALRRVGFRWHWRFDFRSLHLQELGRIAGWMACYVAVSQVGVLVIIRLAYAAGAAETSDGAKAAGAFIYNNAFLLFMMAHGIVAVSIITALMPRMSAAAANQEYHEVARNISLGTRLTSVVLIPVTAAYLVLGEAITSVLFQYGRYDAASARSAALVVAVAGLGLVPFAISQLQTFAFYALTETRTAALVNIPVVATKVIVDLTIFYTVDARYVAAGLMVGNFLSYLLGAVLSARLLRSRLGPMGQGAVLGTLARLAVAGAIGATACLSALWVLDLVLADGKIANLVRIVLGGLVLAVAYLLAASAMRVREISQAFEMVNRKLGGRLPVPSRRGGASDRTDAAPASPGGRPAHDERMPGRHSSDHGPLRQPDHAQPDYGQPAYPTHDGGASTRPVRREQGTVYGSRARQQQSREDPQSREEPGYLGRPRSQAGPPPQDPSHHQDGTYPDDQRPYPGHWEGR